MEKVLVVIGPQNDLTNRDEQKAAVENVIEKIKNVDCDSILYVLDEHAQMMSSVKKAIDERGDNDGVLVIPYTKSAVVCQELANDIIDGAIRTNSEADNAYEITVVGFPLNTNILSNALLIKSICGEKSKVIVDPVCCERVDGEAVTLKILKDNGIIVPEEQMSAKGTIEELFDAVFRTKSLETEIKPMQARLTELRQEKKVLENCLSPTEKKFLAQKIYDNFDTDEKAALDRYKAEVNKAAAGPTAYILSEDSYTVNGKKCNFDPFIDKWEVVDVEEDDRGYIRFKVSCLKNEGSIGGLLRFLSLYTSVWFSHSEIRNVFNTVTF